MCATKKLVINELGDGFKKIYMERKRFKESVLINTYRHIFLPYISKDKGPLIIFL